MENKARQYASFTLLILAAIVVVASGTSALAQRPSRVSEQQVDLLLNRIDVRVGIFRSSLDDSLDRFRRVSVGRADELRDAMRSFDAAVDRLQNRFRNQTDTDADARDVLNSAARVDILMRNVTLTSRARNDWRALRSDLNRLANFYNISWSWDSTSFPPSGVAGTLQGTWRLNPSASENIERAIDRAVRNLSVSEREQMRESLRRRLEPADTIAIDQVGRRFTIASTRTPQITFEASGRSQTEYIGNRAVRVTSSVVGDQLVINSAGERPNFHITFDPIDDGRRMQVTHRMTVARLAQPIVLTSVYDRTSDVAQLDLYRGQRVRVRGPFTVPNGTTIIAVLNDRLDSEIARQGQSFTMTVRSPARYEGAVIEGVVLDVDRAGALTGRSEMTLDFERIRMRDGRVFDFDGYIVQVDTPGIDDEVRVDNEGAIREEDSQTERTITRTGLGAAIGALIGAIAGGGSGAAIGAAVGAGAGAGSVFIQGRQDVELPSGTEVTIRATSPRIREARR
jgi:hypothetical protein